MESIQLILQETLDHHNYSRESLAQELGVSLSTIGRWLNGESQPRPLIEGKLREIYESIQSLNQVSEQRAFYAAPLLVDESHIRDALDETLKDLREALHRRGRLSSRNEALDELSKLLFAHIMMEGGISKKTVLGDTVGTDGAAQSLVEFVKKAFDIHLPKSLGYETGPSDFELKLKEQEDILAVEIIESFERLTASSLSKGIDSIRGVDVLNEVFGKFLADSFANEKELGQYLTPSEVVRFMVGLAIQDMSSSELNTLCSPSQCVNFGLVLDPSCGVGSFLTEFLRTLLAEVTRRNGIKDQTIWVKNMVTHVVAGIDKSERMIRLALTNMAMFGFPTAHLHLANSLARLGPDSELSKSLEGRVRLILTNPPFGAEFHGDDLSLYEIASSWSEKSTASIDSELLFIERYLDWLAPGGQFLAIVPDSILTNKGIYQHLRESIRSNIDIRSVVSLPEVTFRAAGTNTKTSILHIRKLDKSVKKRDSSFFAVCQDVGFEVRTKNAHRTKTRNGHGDLPKILQAASDSENIATYGRRVSDVEQASRWDANYHISLPVEIEQRLKNPAHDDVFLSDVAQLVNERTDPRRWGTGSFQYIEISDIDSEICMVRPKTVPCIDAPSRARKLVQAGDVLVSTVRPERRTIGVVRSEHDNAVCSTGLAVLRPLEIHPLTLAYLLKTDFVTMQILRNTLGIAYPAVDEQCLLEVLLPIKREEMKKIERQADSVLGLEKQVRSMRAGFASVIRNLAQRWSDPH
jgi:type I restriction-modification system DNA methylase subunit